MELKVQSLQSVLRSVATLKGQAGESRFIRFTLVAVPTVCRVPPTSQTAAPSSAAFHVDSSFRPLAFSFEVMAS